MEKRTVLQDIVEVTRAVLARHPPRTSEEGVPRSDPDGAILIGVAGPQGSGKTTATQQAAKLLNEDGIETIALSIDDFYLPFTCQRALAAHGNRFLSGRGPPGTHDTKLLAEALESLRAGRLPYIPAYDKSRHGGRGDRVVREKPVVRPPQVVLLEGWCLGFRPVEAAEIDAATRLWMNEAWSWNGPQSDLLEINDILASSYAPLWDLLDDGILLRAHDLSQVYSWRQEQESELRKACGAGMTAEEVNLFVDRYMPFYRIYVGTEFGFTVTRVLDQNREFVT